MRIGIDARLIGQTGVGRYIRNLIENLAEIDKNNNYVLFVRNKDLEEFKKWKMRNGKWKIVIADISWHSVKEQFKFKNILNEENLDLVHFPYFSVPIFYNKPFVVTIHDLILHHYPTGKASTLPTPIYWAKIAFYKFVIYQAVRKARKIITVSNSTKDEIVDHLGIDPKKIVVTYEAVDDKITNPKLQKINGKWKMINGKYFLFVGNVYPHKNAEGLIKAFEKLGRSDVNLIFVGKEDYFYQRLKERLKGVNEIKFLSDVKDEELSLLYQNAIVLVCPAFMEGFGLPALEAMANKCLVIVSDIPALREVCGENAIYFDPKNPDELAGKMREVLKGKDEYKDMIEMGFKRSQEFSWRKMAEQTFKIYEEVLR